MHPYPSNSPGTAAGTQVPSRRRVRVIGGLATIASLSLAGGLLSSQLSPAVASPASPASPATVKAQDATPPAEQFIVAFNESAPRAGKSDPYKGAKDKLKVGISEVRDLASNAKVITTDRKLQKDEARQLIAEVEADPSVDYVELDVRATIQTNDTLYGSLWGLQGTTAGVNAPGAWPTAGKGAGTVVAVLDTGSTSHPDLTPNMVSGYDFVSNSTLARDGNGRDSNPQDQGDWQGAQECAPGNPQDVARNSSWHGTHVGGTIAAVGDNGQGVVGVAPQAKIQPVRVLAKCGGSTSDISDAVIWASGGSVPGAPANANPAKVINMSLGGRSDTCPITYQRAIDQAVSRGATVVVSAGNSAMDASLFTPANCQNVVTVAALDIGGNRAYYSNFGSSVDVAAPGGETAVNGEGINSTLNSGTTTPGSATYRYYQGTSMSAPHVSGVVALLQGKNLTPAQIEQRLKSTTRPIPGACAEGCGTGAVDAAKAVAAQ